MKVYVDELPKSCEECPMCRSGKLKLKRKGRYVEAEQCVFGQYKYQTMDDEIDTCPLQSLANYTKQVRKEVCDSMQAEIEERARYSTNNNDGWDILIDENSFLEILDQIQGE